MVGDFDTIDSGTLNKYAGMKEVEVIRLNPEKDLTDTQSAIERALSLGADYIEIIGGTGTRLTLSRSSSINFSFFCNLCHFSSFTSPTS